PPSSPPSPYTTLFRSSFSERPLVSVGQARAEGVSVRAEPGESHESDAARVETGIEQMDTQEMAAETLAGPIPEFGLRLPKFHFRSEEHTSELQSRFDL